MPPATSLAHLPQRAVTKRGVAALAHSNNAHRVARTQAPSALVLVAPSQGRSHDASKLACTAPGFGGGSRFSSTAVATPAPSPIANLNNIPSNTTSSSTTQAQTTPPTTRSLHCSTPHSRPTLATHNSALPLSSDTFAAASSSSSAAGTMPPPTKRVPLSALPTSHVVRSLMTATISSSPTLLPPSLMFMSFLANATSPLLNPDRNPLVRWGLKSTFYRQFCAGENGVEVAQTAKHLRSLGFSGIVLNYAREIVLSKEAKAAAAEKLGPEEYARCIAEEVIPWATGQFETIRMAQQGDFVAVKFSGAGRLAISALSRGEALPPELGAALDAICSFAVSRGIRLLFDAEQFSLQAGIDDWTMQMMRRYNTTSNQAFIYNTYQCYLKSTPATISSHLAMATKEGFTLGAKVVRGAYMGIDPRELMWDTKEQTDVCFDSVAASLLRREWDNTVQGSGEFPDVSICLATHNAESVRLARKISQEGSKTDLSIAQLQGMADDVSCELITGNDTATEKAKAFKYLAWGTTGECMKYLLRRAEENKDAVQRTRDTRDAMKIELTRRVKGMFGFA